MAGASNASEATDLTLDGTPWNEAQRSDGRGCNGLRRETRANIGRPLCRNRVPTLNAPEDENEGDSGGMPALEGKHVRLMCLGLLPAAPAAVDEQPRLPDSSHRVPGSPSNRTNKSSGPPVRIAMSQELGGRIAECVSLLPVEEQGTLDIHALGATSTF